MNTAKVKQLDLAYAKRKDKLDVLHQRMEKVIEDYCDDVESIPWSEVLPHAGSLDEMSTLLASLRRTRLLIVSAKSGSFKESWLAFTKFADEAFWVFECLEDICDSEGIELLTILPSGITFDGKIIPMENYLREWTQLLLEIGINPTVELD